MWISTAFHLCGVRQAPCIITFSSLLFSWDTLCVPRFWLGSLIRFLLYRSGGLEWAGKLLGWVCVDDAAWDARVVVSHGRRHVFRQHCYSIILLKLSALPEYVQEF